MSKAIVLGSDELTINSSGRFTIGTRRRMTEGGKCEGTVVTVTVEGDITSNVITTATDYTAEAIEELAAKRLQIQEDGSAIDGWDWEPSDVAWGPYLTEFDTFDDPGAGESHLRYRMVFVFEAVGNVLGGGGSPVKALRTSIQEIDVNGKLVKKVWKAECRAKDADTALSEILAFAPAIEKITSDVEVFRGDTAGARGIWTWDARKDANGILSVECRTTISAGGDDYEADPQAGAPPIFQKALEQHIVTEIETTIRSFNPDVVAFADHCNPDGKTIVKKSVLSGQNPKAFVASKEDALAGIYTLVKREVYWSSVSPAIVHAGDHNKISFSDPPGDGAIGDT